MKITGFASNCKKIFSVNSIESVADTRRILESYTVQPILISKYLFSFLAKQDCLKLIPLISKSEVVTINDIKTLSLISTTIFNFLDENDVILYYYCSDDQIYQRKNREEISPLYITYTSKSEYVATVSEKRARMSKIRKILYLGNVFLLLKTPI